MPKTIAQTLKLCTNVGAVREPTDLVAIIPPSVIRSLEHGTRLPGGFHELHLTLAATESEFREWRQHRLLGRLTLEEPSGRTTWEGRVEAVALADRWQATLTARGYWSNLTDSVRNRSYVSGSDTGGSIITDLLGDIHPQARQLSTSTKHVAAGPTIVHEYNDDWTVWRILTDPRRGVASFGSGSGTGMDVAVWEDRKLHYRPRSAPGAIWHSYMRPENGGGVVDLPLRVDWNDVANIGESTSATAIQRRDTELNLRSRLSVKPPAGGLSINRVWDADGIEWPLCRVRAGDVVRIPDFTPSTDDLDRLVFDAYRTFFIEETHCDHVTGVLTIRPKPSTGLSPSAMIL